MFSIGVDQTITIPGGPTCRLGRLTLAVIRQYQEYVARSVGDPFRDVEKYLGRAPDAVINEAFKAACDLRDQLKYFSLGAPVAHRALMTEEGGAKLLHLLMQQVDAQASEADAYDLLIYLFDTKQLGDVITKAQGGTVRKSEGNEAPASGPASAGAT